MLWWRKTPPPGSALKFPLECGFEASQNFFFFKLILNGKIWEVFHQPVHIDQNILLLESPASFRFRRPDNQ